jgi:N-methylhydantoinase B/oxoprolinase/acetone carboxylase alpha subunit
MTFSCYHSSERLYPWGLFGGGEGTLSSFRVKAPGDEGYANFKERYGVRCAGKFTNVHLPEGSLLELKVGGGGGYGPASERDPALIAEDLLDGLYDETRVRELWPDRMAEALRIRGELLAALRRRSER